MFMWLDGLASEQIRRQERVERGGRGSLVVRVGPESGEASPRGLLAGCAPPRAAAARAQVLEDHLHLGLGGRLREYRRVTQHAVV